MYSGNYVLNHEMMMIVYGGIEVLDEQGVLYYA